MADKKCDKCEAKELYGIAERIARNHLGQYTDFLAESLPEMKLRHLLTLPQSTLKTTTESVYICVGSLTNRFRNIIAKYGLDKEDKADAISELLTNASANEAVSVSDFAEKYGMTYQEAYSFLAFIDVGVKYKEEHLKPNTDSFLEQMGGKK